MCAAHVELKRTGASTPAPHFISHAPHSHLLQLLHEQLPQLSRVAIQAIPGLALRFREVAEDDLDRRAVIELFCVFCILLLRGEFPRVSPHGACPFSFAPREVRAVKPLHSTLPQAGSHLPSNPRRWRPQLP